MHRTKLFLKWQNHNHFYLWFQIPYLCHSVQFFARLLKKNKLLNVCVCALSPPWDTDLGTRDTG